MVIHAIRHVNGVSTHLRDVDRSSHSGLKDLLGRILINPIHALVLGSILEFEPSFETRVKTDFGSIEELSRCICTGSLSDVTETVSTVARSFVDISRLGSLQMEVKPDRDS